MLTTSPPALFMDEDAVSSQSGPIASTSPTTSVTSRLAAWRAKHQHILQRSTDAARSQTAVSSAASPPPALSEAIASVESLPPHEHTPSHTPSPSPSPHRRSVTGSPMAIRGHYGAAGLPTATTAGDAASSMAAPPPPPPAVVGSTTSPFAAGQSIPAVRGGPRRRQLSPALSFTEERHFDSSSSPPATSSMSPPRSQSRRPSSMRRPPGHDGFAEGTGGPQSRHRGGANGAPLPTASSSSSSRYPLPVPDAFTAWMDRRHRADGDLYEMLQWFEEEMIQAIQQEEDDEERAERATGDAAEPAAARHLFGGDGGGSTPLEPHVGIRFSTVVQAILSVKAAHEAQLAEMVKTLEDAEQEQTQAATSSSGERPLESRNTRSSITPAVASTSNYPDESVPLAAVVHLKTWDPLQDSNRMSPTDLDTTAAAAAARARARGKAKARRHVCIPFSDAVVYEGTGVAFSQRYEQLVVAANQSSGLWPHGGRYPLGRTDPSGGVFPVHAFHSASPDHSSYRLHNTRISTSNAAGYCPSVIYPSLSLSSSAAVSAAESTASRVFESGRLGAMKEETSHRDPPSRHVEPSSPSSSPGQVPVQEASCGITASWNTDDHHHKVVEDREASADAWYAADRAACVALLSSSPQEKVSPETHQPDGYGTLYLDKQRRFFYRGGWSAGRREGPGGILNLPQTVVTRGTWSRDVLVGPAQLQTPLFCGTVTFAADPEQPPLDDAGKPPANHHTVNHKATTTTSRSTTLTAGGLSAQQSNVDKALNQAKRPIRSLLDGPAELEFPDGVFFTGIVSRLGPCGVFYSVSATTPQQGGMPAMSVFPPVIAACVPQGHLLKRRQSSSVPIERNAAGSSRQPWSKEEDDTPRIEWEVFWTTPPVCCTSRVAPASTASTGTGTGTGTHATARSARAANSTPSIPLHRYGRLHGEGALPCEAVRVHPTRMKKESRYPFNETPYNYVTGTNTPTNNRSSVRLPECSRKGHHSAAPPRPPSPPRAPSPLQRVHVGQLRPEDLVPHGWGMRKSWHEADASPTHASISSKRSGSASAFLSCYMGRFENNVPTDDGLAFIEVWKSGLIPQDLDHSSVFSANQADYHRNPLPSWTAAPAVDGASLPANGVLRTSAWAYVGSIRDGQMHGQGMYWYRHAVSTSTANNASVGCSPLLTSTSRGAHASRQSTPSAGVCAEGFNDAIESAKSEDRVPLQRTDDVFDAGPMDFVYVGSWDTGMMHGPGVLMFGNGNVWRGKMENNERQTGRYLRRDGVPCANEVNGDHPKAIIGKEASYRVVAEKRKEE